MKTRCGIALVVIAALCISASAQENTVDDWYKKAMELYINGSYEDAISAYNKSIEIDPQNSTLWISKASALRDSGKFPQAIEAYGKAAELNPQEMGIWTIQGFLLSELGKEARPMRPTIKQFRPIPTAPEPGATKLKPSITWAGMTKQSGPTRSPSRSQKILLTQIPQTPIPGRAKAMCS